MSPARVPRFKRRVNAPFIGGNAVRLLRDGREAFPAMLEAISRAERQILLEMYWFDSDAMGRRFADALVEARGRGVEVAVIYDAVGSLGADRGMFAELEERGVYVLEFNPVAPWRHRFRLSFSRLSRRDHRKLLVVDGNVGFTGGINLALPWAPADEGGGGWRDDMMRIEGPAVNGLTRCFHRVWRRQRLPKLLQLRAETPPAAPGTTLVLARILGERYFRHRHAIAVDYASRIGGATQRVYISNAYFVPDGAIRRALVTAARRGVDVRVIVPSQSDVELVKHAGRAQYERLLRAGVRIFEWQSGMFHAKTAVIDGEWCTTGTFNFDYLSLRYNLEVNASVLDAPVAREVEAAFREDLTACVEVRLEDVRARPLSQRLLEQGLYRLRKLL